MRNLYCILLAFCIAVSASAQKVYFIYLQTDNYTPFYVKMNDQIYSASTAGYLILSNLKDSTYHFSVGFPSSHSESKFSVPVNGRDRGFLIKDFSEGLGLFDLQSLSIIRAQKEDTDKTISYQRRNDDFSSLLSKAAHDTSLLYAVVITKPDISEQKQPVVATTDVKPDDQEVKFSLKDIKDSVVSVPPRDINTGEVAGVETKTEAEKNAVDSLGNSVAANLDRVESQKPDVPVVDSAVVQNTEVFKRSVVKKHSESSTSEGFGLVYYDEYDGGKDTIRLLIPNPPIIFKQTTDQDTSLQQDNFIHVDDLKRDTVQEPQVVAVKNTVPVKSHCKSVASHNDFFKLRKNMAAEITDEAMVAEAKKFFKSKCFTIEQIKNLSALFLTSAGKYLFFDAAYLHVSDQENFPSLESEIKDDYYLKRFKALVGE